MTKTGIVAIVAMTIMQTAAVQAQNLREAGPPAEFPPASYTANQYVDSNGCVYIRAGIGGTTNWVPRVNRQREVLCGFQPSIARQAEPEAPATVTAQAPAAATPAPAARPTTTTREPIQTVASIPASQPPRRQTPPAGFTPPRTIITSAPEPAAPAAPRSPVITRITGTSTVAGPGLNRDGTSDAAAPARLTRSEFCEGRVGVQQGFISSRTGQPIDCGGSTVAAATQVAAVAAPAPEADGVRRVTRAEICAEIRSTGRQFINARTGQPVQCPVDPNIAAQVAQARTTAPEVVAPRAVASSNCGRFTGVSAQYVADIPGFPLRCGPQAQSPVVASAAAAPSQRTSTKTTRPFNPQVPASNPTFAVDPNPAPPPGYERVWGDGRLNPYRGLQHARPVQQGTAQTTHFSSRAVAPPAQPAPRAAAPSAAPSNPYVQVATFASQDQAQSVARSLRAQGLPMRIAVYERNGTQYRIVLAGPFTSQSRVNSALGVVRGAGYSGARPASY